MARRRPPVLALLLFGAAFIQACNGGTPTMIDWDLSSSRRPAAVGWQLTGEELADKDLDAHEVESASSVRIRLPEGKVFEAPDDVRDVIVGREGDLLDNVQVTFNEQTADAAHDRATALIRQWGLDGRNIETWYLDAKGKTGSEAADVDVSGAFAEVLGPGTGVGRIGPDGPVVTVEIRYSFDGERPFLVAWELNWTRRN